jgi:3-methyl-2-oxobutanoate hydroxymethyltransferase
VSVTVRDVAAYKREGHKFCMLTAWDAVTARIIDDAGIPLILTGDTMAMTVLGYETTVPIPLEEILFRAAAVVRGTTNALVIGDMPFGTYEASIEQGVRTAVRFLKEAETAAVKFEGAHPELARALTNHGIPVMGHLGLTPQSVNAVGGFKVQGRGRAARQRLLDDALAMQDAGVFALVLEAVPTSAALEVTEALTIPTIGIGAGPHCDGQVLVTADLLGLWTGHQPRFVKTYANLYRSMLEALKRASREMTA